MKQFQDLRTTLQWQKLTVPILGVVLALVASPFTTGSMNAASATTTSVSATAFSGEPPSQYSRHWFTLEATGDGDDDEDGNTVKLWLSYDPQNDALDGLVNFYILSPEGLRNHEGGMNLRQANLAAGNPYKPEKEDYAVNMAEFTERGYQHYSVVFFNRSNTPVQYKLWVEGGEVSGSELGDSELSGGEAQAASSVSSDVVRTDMGNSNTAVTIASAVNITSVTQPAVGTVITQSAPAVQTASSTRMSGQLNKTHEWHFATVRPSEQDGEITITVDVDPDDNDAVQFYVLSPNSLRDVINGANPRLVNLGAGSPVDDNQDGDQESGKLRATINATGYEPYTVIIFSETDATASYTLMVEEGALVQ